MALSMQHGLCCHSSYRHVSRINGMSINLEIPIPKTVKPLSHFGYNLKSFDALLKIINWLRSFQLNNEFKTLSLMGSGGKQFNASSPCCV